METKILKGGQSPAALKVKEGSFYGDRFGLHVVSEPFIQLNGSHQGEAVEFRLFGSPVVLEEFTKKFSSERVDLVYSDCSRGYIGGSVYQCSLQEFWHVIGEICSLYCMRRAEESISTR